MPFFRPSDGLKWAAPKGDRLQVTSGAVTVRYIIHETLQAAAAADANTSTPSPMCASSGGWRRCRRTSRSIIPLVQSAEALRQRPSRSSVAEDERDGDRQAKATVVVNVVELLGGILPVEDGQELDDAEVAQHVEQAKQAEAEAEKIRAGAEADASRTAAGDDADPLGSATTPRKRRPTPRC